MSVEFTRVRDSLQGLMQLGHESIYLLHFGHQHPPRVDQFLVLFLWCSSYSIAIEIVSKIGPSEKINNCKRYFSEFCALIFRVESRFSLFFLQFVPMEASGVMTELDAVFLCL